MDDTISARYRLNGEEAVEANAPWIIRLGVESTDPAQRNRWLAEVITVAAYRDRYAVTSARPLGGPARTDAQRRDRLRAGQAAREAQRIAADRRVPDSHALVTEPQAIG